MEPLSRAQRKAEHNTDRRLRELYRFYDPVRPTGIVPSWQTNVEDGLPRSTGSPIPTSSPDGSRSSRHSSTAPSSIAAGPETLVLGTSNKTLTSFAQLAALRLNAERAFICVLGRNKQYVLAEATQSLNLSETSAHDDKDQLWLGSTGSQLTWSICRDTVALPPPDPENSLYNFLVVNDMAMDERYQQLPFVQNDPNLRFYAGTPLTTEKGINLGCFFVMDKSPRDGLMPLEKDTLGTLSALAIDYLKVCREASEGRRAARLSRGLSYFVDGSSSFVNTTELSRADSCGPHSTNPSFENCISMPGDSPGNSPRTVSQASHRNPRSPSMTAPSVSSQFSDSKQETGTSGGLSSLPEWITSSSRNPLPTDDSQGNSWCFRRAANLLRESLDLSNEGGVVFFEANNHSALAENDISGSDCSSSDSSGPAAILSMSTNDEPFFPHTGSMTDCPTASLDRSFLTLLLKRYPRGKLWSFHRDGLITSSDDDDKVPRNGDFLAPNRSPTDRPTFDMSNPLGKRRKAAENTMLNQYFPNATQIIFVPLWSTIGSQWFSGCFCWTTLETQVFTSAVELSSVMGFGSSIMSEYSRVESLIADRQKGDFIGSISHELRSPLHGILAAAEFLNTTNLNEFQDSLLETVNACGRTLLDTMNQVLDFSKVVSLERTLKSLKRKNESPLDFKGTRKLGSHLDSYVITDLAILTEEVVEGICLGHTYGQNSTASADLPMLFSSNAPKPRSHQSNVEVVLDIQHRDWVYRTQPGALRRIVMNIFGNAMKYTDSGRVCLSLEASSHSEGHSRRQGLEDMVTLTVSDTGRGISEEFLRGRLYTPFAQEDTLAVGTGLGLSIVRSLVKSLNGHIRVRSRIGEGTVVRVSLPLARSVGTESPFVETDSHSPHQMETLTQSIMLRKDYPGKQVAIWGVESAQVAEDSSWAEIARYMTDWFGMRIVNWPPSEPIDILLVKEDHLHELRKYGLSTALPALLVLCHRAMDYSVVRSEWIPLASSVDIIRRPCGPHKLARRLLKALQHAQSAAVTPISVLHDPMDLPIRVPSTSHTAVSSPVIHPLVSPTISEFSTEVVDASEISPPVPIAKVKAMETSLAPLPAETPASPSQTARILVVDDNRINLNLMMTLMKRRGITELVGAENGKIAVDAVEQMPNGYDIIFMDISMPVMTGLEATRAIRSLEKEHDGRKPAIIIALTGLSSPRDASEAMASGMDLFLTKPVSFREVSRLLDEWEQDGLVSKQRTPS
ncbi:hypothetical protein N7495_009566 [Penicillium taxi]|uniref:uncharacterized protein n=1 Tax=Penicillium taxi TaxID=168475 RepID=UPI0025456BC5|nr:uncharacterized protein N7495_009566 [Penicillium taxi]KAJ5885056.1 hypothetical protein N7495_009566 [Penicillium taxi]